MRINKERPARIEGHSRIVNETSSFSDASYKRKGQRAKSLREILRPVLKGNPFSHRALSTRRDRPPCLSIVMMSASTGATTGGRSYENRKPCPVIPTYTGMTNDGPISLVETTPPYPPP